MKLEGFEIRITEGKGCFVITIPEMPGVVGQVRDISDAKKEARALLGAHLRHLASVKRRPLSEK